MALRLPARSSDSDSHGAGGATDSRRGGGRLQLRTSSRRRALSSAAQSPTLTREGAIEFAITNFSSLEGSVKIAGLVSLPFIFDGQKDAIAAMSGPFGKAVRTAVEKSGLMVFDVTWDGGFRQITNSIRPIRTAADMKGLKIRTPPAPISVALFKALGSTPTTVDGPEMYAACQSHLVDGTDNAFSSVLAFKLYEVQKYGSIVNSAWASIPQICNPAAWQRLPPNVQDIAARNINAAGTLEQADMAKLDAGIAQTLGAKGMAINQADSASFKDMLQAAGLYSQWRSLYGAAAFDLLQQAVGKKFA